MVAVKENRLSRNQFIKILVYLYKNQLAALFKNHSGLVNEWKIIENQHQIKLWSTNPFLNDIARPMDING